MRYRIWLIVLLVLSVTGAYLFSTLQAEPDPKMRIICILKTTERNGFWNSLTEGIEAAMEEYDADVRITGPDEESDVEQQNKIIRDAVAEKPDVIVLDPPRDGIHPKALPKILSYGVNRIVYVSCKATSLARDLEAFLAAGYRLEKACCVDQFCETVWTEAVALLVKE